ncbi:hypothetical protein EEB13_24015 [Rhodococcus sp. WS3]|nr:hypothetical protein EEB13_24015 [Rhodococcus sp. WS3]
MSAHPFGVMPEDRILPILIARRCCAEGDIMTSAETSPANHAVRQGFAIVTTAATSLLFVAAIGEAI